MNLAGLFVCLLFPLLWINTLLSALDPDRAVSQYHIHTWDMESGLPANSINAIRQTHDGYLWIGTQDGLVRFDGLNFELFNRSNIAQLGDNIIRALYQDRNGTLWIGTSSGGLTGLKHGRFRTWSPKTHKFLDKISAIGRDHMGNLWIGSTRFGLTCFQNDRFTNFTKKNGLPSNKVTRFHQDCQDNLWVVTESGIVNVQAPGVFKPRDTHNRFNYFHSTCLAKDGGQELWIGTGSRGLFRMKNNIFTSYGTGDGIPHLTISALYGDRAGNMWIGTEGGGLARRSGGKFTTLSNKSGLNDGSVSVIYEDNEENLWVGTLDGGLHQLMDSRFITYTIKEGLPHNYVLCTYEDRTGKLWTGTKGGLCRLQDQTWTTVLTTANGLAGNTVVAVNQDLSGNLWIGTWSGLQKFKDGSLSSYTQKAGLSDHRINTIYTDSLGIVWVGTQNGLNRFQEKSNRFIPLTDKDGLVGQIIEFILQDSRGNLLVGTNATLNLVRQNKITPYALDPGHQEAVFRCAYEDEQGSLWFGTDSGLIYSRGNRSTRITVQNGLNENNIISIMEDNRGYFWLAGPNGISRIPKNELQDLAIGTVRRLHPQTYNEHDGMKSRWVTDAGCRTRDNRLWFPTSVGISMIDPADAKEKNLSIPVIIERFLVDGNAVNLTDQTGLHGSIPLAPGKKKLEFYYTAASFIKPRKISFKTKLEGYETHWVKKGNLRTGTYTELSPGQYTFKVMACNADGVWSRKEASVTFYLKPWFYQTTLFYIALLLWATLSLYLVYRLRVRQLKRRAKELTQLVNVRTKDLHERNNELQSTHQKLRESKDIIEEKNRNIMGSIRYARNIQHAMLPVKEKMEKHLEDSYIIYLPKDIVSGDFYWFDVVDNYKFLALADCTGHGVPGALLSMIGYMMLNEAIHERRILDPAKILARLHQGFRYILKQQDVTDIYDGMDIGLCRIDIPGGEIMYAGARRPLYYVRGRKLFEIKGDRKSIGGRQKEAKHVFSNHKIHLHDNKNNGIMLYLSTDGFVDQNNPLDQKYGSRQFKKFLLDNVHLSAVQQQTAFLEELKNHRAEEEQRDDISIIGARIFPGCKD